MKRLPPFLFSCVWGALCAAILGAMRVHAAALHLLTKGKALEAQGIPSLPGPEHWATLSSLAPAGAGALFFGLSIGLGSGALLSAWVDLIGQQGRGRHWIRWLCLLGPLWALWTGDTGLAVTLLALTLGICLYPRSEQGQTLLPLAACVCVVAVGLLPWAQAKEGPFSRLRDRFLLSTAPGLAVNHFYYRWTLFPAAVIKPLDRLTQPTAALHVPADQRLEELRFRAAAPAFGILCLSGANPGADFSVAWAPSGPQLSSAGVRVPWPADRSAQQTVWRSFSTLTDRAGPLRTATAFALFTACPLGFAWALGSLFVWVGRRASPRMPVRTALLLASLSALGLAASGRAGPSLAPATALQIPEALASPSAARRLYAVRAAPLLGRGASPLLLRALSDPVVNVRYAAAEALGALGDPAAGPRLLEVLRGSDEWYVKERAYAALWKLGWRPQK